MSEVYFDCPYCNKEISEELEGENAYDEYEGQCYECKKKYNYRLNFSVDVDAYQKKEEVKQ